MNTRIKSALNQIKAEDTLLTETEEYLREVLTKEQNSKGIKFSKDKLFFMKKMAIAIVFIIVFLSGSTGAYAYYKTPVSYLSLDINPSIELGVNAFYKVVKVEGYNDDGEKMLEGIDVTGLNVEEAVKTLVETATYNGYIADDGSTVISLTTETDDSKTSTKLEINSEAGANQALKENGKIAVIHKDNVPFALNGEAKALGVTAGKLNIIRKLQSVEPTATVDEYKNKSVKNIMKSIQENIKNENNVNEEDEGNSENKSSENKTDDRNMEEKNVETENKTEDSNVESKNEGTVNKQEDNTVEKNNQGTVNKEQNSIVDKKEDKYTNKNNEGASEEKDKSIDNGNKNNRK